MSKKNFFFIGLLSCIALGVTPLSTSCSDNMGSDGIDSGTGDSAKLISPKMNFAVRSLEALGDTTAFNGYLLVFSCDSASTTYFGNYTAGLATLSPIYASYRIANGTSTPPSNPIYLPIGKTFNMLYWATDNEQDYSNYISNNDGLPLSIGDDLNNQQYLLFSQGDTAYSPFTQLYYATQNVTIGSDSLGATLNYATAMLNVSYRDSLTNRAFSTGDTANYYSSIEITLNNVPYALNIATGQPNFSSLGNVNFNLVREDSIWVCDSVFIFPTSSAPAINIKVFADGVLQIEENKTLNVALTAGSVTNLNINGGLQLNSPAQNIFTITTTTIQNDTLNIQ